VFKTPVAFPGFGMGSGKLLVSDSDGLFPATKLEHVDLVVDDGVEAGANVNKRF